MSWSDRFGSWGGKFSPFGRASPNSSGQVNDTDFSYITDEDLARSKDQHDVVVLKQGRISYPLHFIADSIDSGRLKIGDIRSAAAKKLGLPAADAERIKLLHRGRNLKDDTRLARDEGLQSSAQAELMCIVGEPLTKSESSGSEDDDDTTAQDDDGSHTRKRKPRKRKSKGKRKTNSGTATPTGTERAQSLNPDATYVPHAPPPPRPSSPAAKQAPAQTPLQKLESLASTFHTKFVPECIKFMSNPPSDAAKREYDHKRLAETIMAQILLKADAIEPEGDAVVRQKRKDLVRKAQGMLNKLDEGVKT